MSPAMAAAPLVLEGNGASLALADGADIDGFVAAANAKARIKGLDDGVNPGIIDAAKLRAMVAALNLGRALVKRRKIDSFMSGGTPGP